MGQTAEDWRINRFRKGMDLLKKIKAGDEYRYDNEKIAALLGIHPTNLSSYYTGAKRPGKLFLDKFDVVFGEELKPVMVEYDVDAVPGPDPIETPSSTGGEAPIRSLMTDEQQDSFQTLKVDNEAFRVNLYKIVDTNQTLAHSNQILAQNNQILAQTNQKIVDAHLSFLEEQRKGNKKAPGETQGS